VRVDAADLDEAGVVVYGLAADEGGGSVTLAFIFEERVEYRAGWTGASHRRGETEVAQEPTQVGANGDNRQPLTVLAGVEMASLHHLVMCDVARST
jgi:hypothetical protein